MILLCLRCYELLTCTDRHPSEIVTAPFLCAIATTSYSQFLVGAFTHKRTACRFMPPGKQPRRT